VKTIPSRYDDEVDLFELIKTIWDGKLWIMIASLSSTGLGAMYTTVVPTIYNVQIKATMHAYADATIFEQVAQNSTFDWRISSGTKALVLETKKPESLSVYSKDLQNARSTINSQMIKFKKVELEQISRLNPTLLGTEAVAARVLSNQLFINSFETMGLKPIEFSEPEVKIKSPKTRRIVALAFVIGGIIGVLGVLIRSAYRNRFQNQ